MCVSCKSCDDAAKDGADSASSPSDAAVVAIAEDAGLPPVVAIADPSVIDAPLVIDEPFGDAGTSSCRLAYGPAEQPFRGPAAMLVASAGTPQPELRLIANDSGKPRVYPIAITTVPKSAPPIVPPRPASFVGMRWPPCEIAGRFVYCQGPGGGITRTSLSDRGVNNDSKTVVSKSRGGTRLAAASLGADHSVVSFLDVRQTTEGAMIQAFVALDDREPTRLSEDGAGATTMRFLERGDKPIAIYLDTRTAMVPVHARPLSLRGSDLALGADAVIHVGGAPERGIDFSVASVGANAVNSKGYVFIPMPRDTMDFGMATILVEDPPKDDVPATWSKYPNGLDPAPIGSTPAHDGKGAWIARVRPRDKAVGSPRIVELGRVDTGGVFFSYGEMALGKNVTDLALVDDGIGVWILYGDTTITMLERRICP